MSVPTPEAEHRSAASFRRQCLFAVTILLVEDSRSASEAIRLYAAESGARVRRADSLHAASRHLAIYRPNVGDGRSRPARRRRHRADPPARLRLDARSAPSSPSAATSARAGRRRRSPPAPPPASRSRSRACAPSRNACSRSCPTPRAAAAPTPASWRSPGAPRSAARSPTTCAAPGRSSPRRSRRSDAETVGYCAQFLGSVGEMLGDRDLFAAARAPAREAHRAGGARGRSSTAASGSRRPGRQVA